ncbi:MAG: cell division protein FtsQ/DivIB [Thiohalomonadales bacterium]
MDAPMKGNRLTQKNGNKVSRPWIIRIVSLGFLAVTIMASYQLLSTYLLPIKSLYVTGNIENMDKEDLKQTVKKEIDAGFFAVNVNKIKTAVQELDWVQSVSVRRVWPDSLHIEVTEHIAVARWRDRYLVNERGFLFEAKDLLNKKIVLDKISKLPVITGPKNLFEELYRHYGDIKSVIEKGHLQVVKLEVDARRATRVTLSNGIVLLLGRVLIESHDYQELTRFVSAYNRTLVQSAMNIREIDLRYTNGFAVQWKDRKLAQTNVLPVSSI